MVSTTAKTELVVRRREAEVLATKLRHGEARYRALSGALDDGFCLMEMIADAHGTFVDYRFLEVNDAFVRHTGLVDPVGKGARSRPRRVVVPSLWRRCAHRRARALREQRAVPFGTIVFDRTLRHETAKG